MRVMKIVPGPDLEALPFGLKVRYCRLSIKMSAERFGILYAQAIGRKKPYTARRIEQLEEHDGFPTDKTRRWAIARIVQMGLFFNLASPGFDSLPAQPPQPFPAHRFSKLKLDISDHQAAFQQGWTQGFDGTLEEVEEEYFDRIYDIHDKIPYLSKQQKDQAWRTLCGFHILLASQIYSQQGDSKAMTKSTNMAVIVARENNYPDLRATALLQHAVSARTQGNFADALRDCQAAYRLKGLPPQLRGKILGEMARLKARLAQTQEKVDEALALLDEAEHTIDQSTLEDFGFLVAFNEDKYKLDRGEVLVAAPLKHLRSPEKALSYLPPPYRVEEALTQKQFKTIAYRQALNHRLQAEIYIDQEEYPIALALAQEALAYRESLQSKIDLQTIAQICHALEKSPIGNSIEVTMLGIGIMRNLRQQSLN